jgi:hypothetical protein
MTAQVPGSYMPQTVALGTFNIASTGEVVGTFVDDPSIRNWLVGGVVSQNETIPMWGGLGICEGVLPNLGALPPDNTQGGVVGRASTISSSGAAGALTGFTVFNQAYGMVITPQSAVPLAGSGMQIMYFRLGSTARVVVAAASSIANLEGGPISQNVSWDFVNQQLIPYIPQYAQTNATAVSYTAATGALQLTFAAAPFGATYTGLGSVIAVSGITGTGAGVPQLNGAWPISAIASAGTVITVSAPVGLTASALSGAVLAGGGGAVPCKVIEYLATNNMTVNYNAATNFAAWNYNGSAAIIQLTA